MVTKSATRINPKFGINMLYQNLNFLYFPASGFAFRIDELLYPYKRWKYLLEEEDFFQALVLHCEEAEFSSGGTFLERACREIDADLYEQVRKVYRLYNPHRNLYLDKCYGESKRPLGERMDFTKYEK